MKIKNFLRKGTAVICAAVLVCGFVLPAFSSLAGTNEVDITTSTTMGNAHTGFHSGYLFRQEASGTMRRAVLIRRCLTIRTRNSSSGPSM